MRRTSLFLCLLLACGGDEPEAHEHPTHTGDAGSYEGCPESTPEFALGMRAVGKDKRVTAELVAATPAPPMRYLNDWELRFFSTESDALLSDVSISQARPFMPVHGHDGNILPKLTLLEDGGYRVASLNLNMRGPWEVQLNVSSASLGDDYIVFHVCVSE